MEIMEKADDVEVEYSDKSADTFAPILGVGPAILYVIVIIIIVRGSYPDFFPVF